MCLILKQKKWGGVETNGDAIGECSEHGGVAHVYIDKNSAQSSVHAKCPSVAAAAAAVTALHSRWFASKMVTAVWVPLPAYPS